MQVETLAVNNKLLYKITSYVCRHDLVIMSHFNEVVLGIWEFKLTQKNIQIKYLDCGQTVANPDLIQAEHDLELEYNYEDFVTEFRLDKNKIEKEIQFVKNWLENKIYHIPKDDFKQISAYKIQSDFEDLMRYLSIYDLNAN